MEKNFWLTNEPIEINDVITKVVRPEAGAISTFIGTVREFTEDRRTLYLEYQAYVPMAEKKLAEIADEINQKWANTETAIAHRIGRLNISDVAVAIAVSTPHRKDAFAASRYAIERIKEMVTILKKEDLVEGSFWMWETTEKI